MFLMKSGGLLLVYVIVFFVFYSRSIQGRRNRGARWNRPLPFVRGDKGGQRKVPSMTKSALIVTNIAISAFSLKKCPFSHQRCPFRLSALFGLSALFVLKCPSEDYPLPWTFTFTFFLMTPES